MIIFLHYIPIPAFKYFIWVFNRSRSKIDKKKKEKKVRRVTGDDCQVYSGALDLVAPGPITR